MFLTEGEYIEPAVARKHRQYGFHVEAITNDDLLVQRQRQAVGADQLGRQKGRQPCAHVEPERGVVKQLMGGAKELLRLRTALAGGNQTLLSLANQALPPGLVFVPNSACRRHEQGNARRLSVREQCAKIVSRKKIHGGNSPLTAAWLAISR